MREIQAEDGGEDAQMDVQMSEIGDDKDSQMAEVAEDPIVKKEHVVD